eukprot:m.81844 g.81844  ORF g.81844 m.81844 type:complete len:295 (-) comp25459_c0_seq1:238-1122(-)
MSAEYLRAYMRTTDDAPLEIQRDVTELKVNDCVARALLQKVTELLAQVPQANAEEKSARLEQCKVAMTELRNQIHAQTAIMTTMAECIDKTGNELDKEQEDYRSGDFMIKAKKEQEDYESSLREVPKRKPGPVKRVTVNPGPKKKVAPNPTPPVIKEEHEQPPPNKKIKKRVKPITNKSKDQINHPSTNTTTVKPKVTAKVEPAAPPPQPKVSSKKPKRMTEYCKPDCTGMDGEMVGCDNDSCPHGEWFHLSCVGLRVSPAEDKNWYCPNCRKSMRAKLEEKGRSSNAKRGRAQ